MSIDGQKIDVVKKTSQIKNDPIKSFPKLFQKSTVYITYDKKRHIEIKNDIFISESDIQMESDILRKAKLIYLRNITKISHIDIRLILMGRSNTKIPAITILVVIPMEFNLSQYNLVFKKFIKPDNYPRYNAVLNNPKSNITIPPKLEYSKDRHYDDVNNKYKYKLKYELLKSTYKDIITNS